MTAETRVRAAELIVREQRGESVGDAPAVAPEALLGHGEAVDADDYADLRHELGRLQRAVMGEPQP